jgi:formiminoglutamase
MYDLHDFLEPIQVEHINGDGGYNDGQLAKHIRVYEDEMPDYENADIVIIGVGEERGNVGYEMSSDGPNTIRKHLYQLHYWHTDINIVDLGNVRIGASLGDSYAAVKTVVEELIKQNKTVLILGGSHDITLPQYFAYRSLSKVIEATCIDATINLKGESVARSENFLLEMLTSEPNFVKHYNHIGFQSYFVHPRMLETLDKLRFDCFRLGMVKEKIEEMEPVLRNSHLVSFDVSAIKYSDAPANDQSPNGFTGEEACTLTRYAGMSNNLSSIGIYGYNHRADISELTAKQIAQMVWYFIDGRYKALNENPISDREYYNEYNTFFAEVEAVFLQSQKSGRWWMQLPNKKFIACSYKDYLDASRNEIPERWLRAQERE